MTPVIRRLQDTLFTHTLKRDYSEVFRVDDFESLRIDASDPLGVNDPEPLNWTFSKRIKSLRPEFYRKIIPSHIILNLELSLLVQQLRANLASVQSDQKQIVEQLISALLLAELLEQVYQHYLIVPREVVRLRAQQRLYRDILAELKVPFSPKHLEENKAPPVGSSFSQVVRTETANVNLYRLLFLRSKRTLDLIAAMDRSAYWYRYLIGNLDKYTDPFLPHLSWLFFIPRLSANLFLLIKHTIPGSWMGDKEKSLGWDVRLQGQLLRRWFELGNDVAWFSVGFINCFILTGVLAPVGSYFALAFFGYDVLLSAARAYIELNRLYELRKQYQAMADQAENKEELEQQLKVLDDQINFEKLRLLSHVLTTTGIFFAMCCGAPMFALNPIIPLIGALCLVSICFINFALVSIINERRPKDVIEAPAGGIKNFGFFARKPEIKAEVPLDKDNVMDDDSDLERCCSL